MSDVSLRDSTVRRGGAAVRGWVPPQAGQSNMATNGRAPLAMLALAELVHLHRAQVPPAPFLSPSLMAATPA